MKSEMRWNVEQTEDVVRAVHGDYVADSLHGPIQSLAWKMNMGYYHACESVGLLKDAIYKSEGIPENANEAETAALGMILEAICAPREKTLTVARFKAEAHMIAAAQCLHSTGDIMACVVYWALNLPKKPAIPKYEHLSLPCVQKYLEKDAEYRAIGDVIEALLNLAPFQYLNAYVNTTKHRSIVKAVHTAHVDPAENPRQGLLIKAFQYRGVDYTELWGEEFLFAEAQHIRGGIIAIGNALIAHYA